MWPLTACKISVSLSFLNWIKTEMIFYRISELMLATLIQRYDKNHFNSRMRLKFYRLSGATFYDCIKIEGKAMIRNRYNYPTLPIRGIKGKETQTRNN